MVPPWRFIDTKGSFELTSPHRSSYLYFPLVNDAGMMSSVTPLLHGDIKAGQHSFLTPPVSVEDLHSSRAARNFWVNIPGTGAWSATGNSAAQIACNFTGQDSDVVAVKAGFLWHQLIRKNTDLGLKAEITNFVPASSDQVELMRVRLTNITDQPIQFTPTAAIPIFGRSADNLRDHRHVTSLLHQITCGKYGVLVRPTLSFDERGHHPNHMIYAVLGVEDDGSPPQGFYPRLEDFIGEGGSLDWPESIVKPIRNVWLEGQSCAGYEAIGALRFKEINLLPGQSCAYILLLSIFQDEHDAGRLMTTYGAQEKFDQWLDETSSYWESKTENLSFRTSDPQFDLWVKWVGIQPTLRRLFGNSFLPYHDYGRGGRGWRDLWQDILTLLISETGQLDSLLFENFAGVRMDGSNATIIGSRPGEFKADRNNIPRVWMDHGAWPLLTVRLYLDQTGDLAFLLRDQVYFKDHLTERAQGIDLDWEPAQGTRLLTRTGDLYRGTVLEHLLVQQLTAFFNVGEHNHIKLEGADWNDGMDMAAERGESVAFTAMYASNLNQLGQLVLELRTLGLDTVELAAELLLLLDSLDKIVDYNDIEGKQKRLKEYFSQVGHTVSGKKLTVNLADLADDLFSKADWISAHIRKQEWLVDRQGYGWFNGYYDNRGQRLEGDHPEGVRMTLTGQVFTLMGGIATDEQAESIVQSVDHYLLDVSLGGCRLNTNFKEVLLDMGRCFGFAYGHKENGAMFSHMAVMYAYALYERGFARHAYRMLDLIYQQSINFPISRMYPGIPEYFSPDGRGMYPYLTGSASWYLYTLLTQSYGVRGELGDLLLRPKLVPEQFDAEGKASVHTRFADRKLEVCFQNPDRLDYGSYKISNVQLDNDDLSGITPTDILRIPRQRIAVLEPDQVHRITILLSAK